jgi:hypothetical protein
MVQWINRQSLSEIRFTGVENAAGGLFQQPEKGWELR